MRGGGGSSCGGTVLGTPELHWRRAFKALVGSWRHWWAIAGCRTPLTRQSKLLCAKGRQALCQQKLIRGVLVGALAGTTKTPPFDGNPGLLSRPEQEEELSLFL